MPLDTCDSPFSGDDISDGQFSNAESSDSVEDLMWVYVLRN